VSPIDHHVGWTSRRWIIALAPAAALLCARFDGAAGQTGWVVTGSVVDAGTGAAITNARVTLEFYGAVLTSNRGTFRFERVPSAAHSLRVQALGYRDYGTRLLVRADTQLVVALEIQPIRLDSIGVRLRTIDFDGRVRDPLTNSWIPDADVRSDQGHREKSNLFGRFDLDDAFEGAPIRVRIQAYRFMALDTTFIPDDEERYPFDLAPDPVMTRMIELYTTRLDERGGKYIYKYQPPLNRADLAEFAPNITLRDVIERKYTRYTFNKIICYFIDEQEYRFGADDGDYRTSVFEGTFTNDLERIEVLELPGGPGLFLMVRVYTRQFFQRHAGVPHELATPRISVTMGGTFCR
jgi:hypothetical protein